MKLFATSLLVLFVACSSTPQPTESLPKSVPVAPFAPVVPKKVAALHAGPSALDAKPAAVPMPAAPPAQRAARDAAAAQARDQSGDLTRNASVVGRLPEPGQRASFPFQCEAGEQSLFEIAAFGYTRASDGHVRLAIEDDSGKVVWQSERDVIVTWRDFVAFTAPTAGTWTFSLTVLQGGYRFVLVRHSDYPALGDGPLDVGSRALVHGHLPNAESVARFLVPAKAGEELALKLTGTREEARVEARRGATDMSTMMSRMDSKKDVERMMGNSKLLFQTFDFEAFADGVSLGPLGTYLRLKAPRDGTIEVRVRAHQRSLGGGLFDLEVERELDLLRVSGVVVDSEDQPLANVEIVFLREPDADPVGRARSNERGEYETSVLAGNLAVQMICGPRAAQQSVRVQVTAEMALDLIFQPGAKLRGR